MRLDFEQLYIIGSSRPGKTHLAYVDRYADCVSQVCLPNIPVMAVHTCDDDDGGFPAGRTQVEEWDKYYNEVTCATCLKRAVG
ncbi:hypothetical protein LCGC14_0819690 [marine sediment metagenome]|uniref:Uncharacterized protein n=1 Tax=marine sediment metagenome TaxID=412755 RepID=A0A0F9PJ59_9ZZZZ